METSYIYTNGDKLYCLSMLPSVAVVEKVWVTKQEEPDLCNLFHLHEKTAIIYF